MEVLAGLRGGRRRRCELAATDDDVVYRRRFGDCTTAFLRFDHCHLVPSAAQPLLASTAPADGAVGKHTVIGLLGRTSTEPIAEQRIDYRRAG